MPGVSERAARLEGVMQCVITGDATGLIATLRGSESIIVTDPPFNVGYNYRSYHDRMPEADYLAWLAGILGDGPCVVVHYPEMLHKLSIQLGRAPERVVSWVYNSNTAKQHRDIAFYGVAPDFRKVKQPYKNPNDKRVRKLMEQGKGARLYDWWEVNQVKNVSREKTGHPCQMPVEVMERVIGVLPDDAIIVDPFCGSGTTGVACARLGRNFVGIEVDEVYASIARERIAEAC